LKITFLRPSWNCTSPQISCGNDRPTEEEKSVRLMIRAGTGRDHWATVYTRVNFRGEPAGCAARPPGHAHAGDVNLERGNGCWKRLCGKVRNGWRAHRTMDREGAPGRLGIQKSLRRAGMGGGIASF